MSDQPEALRLADSTHLAYRVGWQREAASCLRRQHAEIEQLRRINQAHEMKLSVRGYEIQIADLSTEIEALKADRNALLEVLQDLMEIRDQCFIPNHGNWWENKARAAIAKATGENK